MRIIAELGVLSAEEQSVPQEERSQTQAWNRSQLKRQGWIHTWGMTGIATTAILLTPCNICGRICLTFTHCMHIYLRCLSTDSSCPLPVMLVDDHPEMRIVT